MHLFPKSKRKVEKSVGKVRAKASPWLARIAQPILKIIVLLNGLILGWKLEITVKQNDGLTRMRIRPSILWYLLKQLEKYLTENTERYVNTNSQ
jgi:hypothetical protein